MLHQLSPGCQASRHARVGDAGLRAGRLERRSAMRFVGRRRILRVQAETHPIRSPEFNRVLCPIRSIAATHGIGRAVFFTAPADALRMARVHGDLWGHSAMLFVPNAVRADKCQFGSGSSLCRITKFTHVRSCARSRSFVECARDG